METSSSLNNYCLKHSSAYFQRLVLSVSERAHLWNKPLSLSPRGWGAGDQHKSSPPQPSAWGHRGQGDPGRDRLLSLCSEPAGCQSGRSLTNPHECDGGAEEGAGGAEEGAAGSGSVAPTGGTPMREAAPEVSLSCCSDCQLRTQECVIQGHSDDLSLFPFFTIQREGERGATAVLSSCRGLPRHSYAGPGSNPGHCTLSERQVTTL